MSDEIILNPHFGEFIKQSHLFADNERLPGPDGTPGKGILLREAVPSAEHWWETKGRFKMPDYGKKPEELVVKSGVMNGLPWHQLTKEECLRVLAHWYANHGVHTIVEGHGSSQDNQFKRNGGHLDVESAEMFPAIKKAKEITHAGFDHDDAQVHEAEYDKMEKGGKILDSSGLAYETNERKDHGNEEESGKDAG